MQFLVLKALFFIPGVISIRKDLRKSCLYVDHLGWMDLPWQLSRGDVKKKVREESGWDAQLCATLAEWM